MFFFSKRNIAVSFSVDLLAHVFDVLKADLKSDVAKELFLYYQGTTVVLQFLKPVNKVSKCSKSWQNKISKVGNTFSHFCQTVY